MEDIYYFDIVVNTKGMEKSKIEPDPERTEIKKLLKCRMEDLTI